MNSTKSNAILTLIRPLEQDIQIFNSLPTEEQSRAARQIAQKHRLPIKHFWRIQGEQQQREYARKTAIEFANDLLDLKQLQEGTSAYNAAFDSICCRCASKDEALAFAAMSIEEIGEWVSGGDR